MSTIVTTGTSNSYLALPRQWRFTLKGAPRTKKTSNRLVPAKGNRRAVILPSAAFTAWNRIAQMELARVRSQDHPIDSAFPIEFNVNVRAWFYRDAERGDACNYYEALADALQEGWIVVNDSQIVSWDGSRLLFDKANPRVEVWITEIL